MPIRLVYKDLSTFNSQWIQPLLDPWFELTEFSESEHYTKHDVYLNASLIPDPESRRFELVVFDNLWEAMLPENTTTGLLLQHRNWFWYNESIWYRFLGYDQYTPQRTHQYRALMPMNMKKPHRTKLLQTLRPVLPEMIWSYAALGQRLPNDEETVLKWLFRPEWYDPTDFSVVAETAVQGQPFLSEKTFKPLAFWHPFMIVSSPGHLAYLQSLGFETFDNMFDQSYDSESDLDQRIKIIADQVIEYRCGDYSDLTWQKLRHNHSHFFSADVPQRICKDILEPIIEYAETR